MHGSPSCNMCIYVIHLACDMCIYVVRCTCDLCIYMISCTCDLGIYTIHHTYDLCIYVIRHTSDLCIYTICPIANRVLYEKISSTHATLFVSLSWARFTILHTFPLLISPSLLAQVCWLWSLIIFLIQRFVSAMLGSHFLTGGCGGDFPPTIVVMGVQGGGDN
jgi:hypothetical protein